MEPKRRARPTDDLDIEGTEAATKGLDRRLLRREPRGQVTPGTCPPAACPQLALTEQPGGQTGVPLQSALDPIDLDQVDPERRNARAPDQGAITAEALVESPLSSG